MRKQLQIEFYFGSQWWALTGETVEWIINYLGQHEDYYIFYKNTVCLKIPYVRMNRSFRHW